MRRLPSRGPPAAAHDRGDFAARDRDSSNSTAWWSKLHSNFGAVLEAALAEPSQPESISARRLLGSRRLDPTLWDCPSYLALIQIDYDAVSGGTATAS